MEREAVYSLDELRPSAVILATKFIKLGNDEYVTAGYVSHYFTLNGHRVERRNAWLDQIILEAKRTPMFPCKRL